MVINPFPRGNSNLPREVNTKPRHYHKTIISPIHSLKAQPTYLSHTLPFSLSLSPSSLVTKPQLLITPLDHISLWTPIQMWLKPSFLLRIYLVHLIRRCPNFEPKGGEGNHFLPDKIMVPSCCSKKQNTLLRNKSVLLLPRKDLFWENDAELGDKAEVLLWPLKSYENMSY